MIKKTIFTFTFLILLYFCSQNPTGPDDKFLSWPPKDIDTTSHNFTWQIDTLEFPGTFQILPKAIWGADTNDVWMVAHSDDWHARIWHWDGKIWSAYTESGLGTSPTDMIGFSKDDIWFCSIRTGDNPIIKTIQHWDGQSWNIVEHQIETDILSMWGSSSQNLYFGLIDGRIAHYDGIDFEIKGTNTSAQILDLHGLSETEIYAVGIEPDKVQPSDTTGYYVFKFDGINWSINNFFLLTIDSSPLELPIRGLWSDSYGFFLGVNRSGVYSYTEKEWTKIYEADGTLALNATSINNMFTAGNNGSAIFHFNGKTWKSFAELKNIKLFTGTNYMFEDHVFIPGSIANRAYILRGRR